MVPRGAAGSNDKYKTLVEATSASINSGVDLETGPVWTGATNGKFSEPLVASYASSSSQIASSVTLHQRAFCATGDDVFDTNGKILPKGGLAEAVAAKTVSMSTIDRALGRALAAKMRLGLFDPLSVGPSA